MHFDRLRRTLALTVLLGGLLAAVAGCDTGELGGTDSAQEAVSTKATNARPNKVNLKRGAVFSTSNARSGNEVAAFSRAPDGTLTRVGSFDTGGTGSGSFEDSSNGMILGNARGESAPIKVFGAAKLLFVTNAGSNSVSVFRVEKDGIELVEVQDSGGEKPVSVTVSKGRVYVLNSGELTDELFDENGELLGNCNSGELPTVTGFTVDNGGQLTPISNSTRTLSEDPISGCAQVSFNPTGDVLVVTERLAEIEGQFRSDDPLPNDEGVIVTFTVNGDGTLGQKRVIDATGQGPFGFTFTRNGALVTSEQFDGVIGDGRGAATGYTVNADGTLNSSGPSVANGNTDTCWFVATDNGRLGFATSFSLDDGAISSYAIGNDGAVTLLDPVATSPDDDSDTDGVAVGASDISFSRNSKYLYQLNSISGTINAFEVNKDGTLTFIQQVQAHDPSPDNLARIGMAAS